MLVNVPALVTAYYTERPDPSVPAQRVAFGSSGHRGSAVDKAFNEAHILAIAQAICLYRAQQRIDGPLFIAGKAHPADQAGQALIQDWIRFVRRPEGRPHAILLSDYDMHLTGQLVQGVDLWINTPRRPWEASGTSGMEVLVNGGLNLSELYGWWAEAYRPDLAGRFHWKTHGSCGSADQPSPWGTIGT